MSQTNIVSGDKTGFDYVQYVNSSLQAVATDFSGSEAPADPFADMKWLDTSVNPAVLKRRNSTNTAWVIPAGATSSGTLTETAGWDDVPSLTPSVFNEQAQSLLNRTAYLESTSGAAKVGATDGSSGTLWTTVQGFITKIVSNAGASVIGCVLSATGALSRTLQSKLFESVSVTDFSGVDKTGASSSLSGFNAALAYAATQTAGGKGFTIRAPAGVYRLDGAVNVPARVKIIGDGSRSTVFILSGTTAGFVFDSVTNSALMGARIGLEDGTNQKAVQIKTTSGTVRWCEIYDLEIAANTPRDQHYGIYATATGGQIVTENDFDRIRTFQVNRPIYRADIEGNHWTNLHLAEHGKAVACPAIDGSSLADFYQGRAAGSSLDGSVGFSDAGARSTAILAVDIGGGSRKAVVLGSLSAHTVILQRPELLTPLGDVGTNNTVIDSGVVISGLQLTTGPALTNGNFALSAEWGSTATVTSIVGNDSRVTFIVNSSGSGQAAYPTVTFYCSQGSWPAAADVIPQVTRNGGNQPTAVAFDAVGNTVGWSFRLYGTPVAGESYVFTVTI